MPTTEIGCGQITWNQFRPEGADPEQWEAHVLSEIAQAGYAGAPAGPWGGRSSDEVGALFARYGLQPAPGYFGAEFWDAAQRDMIVQQARDYARFARALGCDDLYVAANGFNYLTKRGLIRSQVAGHVRPEDALSDAEFRQFADTLNRVGEATLAEGVRSCFHNHVGSVIETREEIDRLLGMVDPALVFLGPDTGHLAWAGADPTAFFRDYADRIKTVHLKDVDAAVRDRGAAAEWDYRKFNEQGVFIELGGGCVDFPALMEILRGVAFSGWLIVETDVTQRASALESAEISRAYLRSIGL